MRAGLRSLFTPWSSTAGMTVEALWHQEIDRAEVVLRSLLQNAMPFFADIASILRCRLESVLRWEKKANGPSEG